MHSSTTISTIFTEEDITLTRILKFKVMTLCCNFHGKSV